MNHCNRTFKTVTPLIPINQAQTICKILEGLLSQVINPALTVVLSLHIICLVMAWLRMFVQCDYTRTSVVITARMVYGQHTGCDSQDGGKIVQLDQKTVEAYFVFACIWAFGGCLAVEKTADHRAQFSQYWVLEWKTVTFPDQVPGIAYGTFKHSIASLVLRAL